MPSGQPGAETGQRYRPWVCRIVPCFLCLTSAGSPGKAFAVTGLGSRAHVRRGAGGDFRGGSLVIEARWSLADRAGRAGGGHLSLSSLASGEYRLGHSSWWDSRGGRARGRASSPRGSCRLYPVVSSFAARVRAEQDFPCKIAPGSVGTVPGPVSGCPLVDTPGVLEGARVPGSRLWYSSLDSGFESENVVWLGVVWHPVISVARSPKRVYPAARVPWTSPRCSRRTSTRHLYALPFVAVSATQWASPVWFHGCSPHPGVRKRSKRWARYCPMLLYRSHQEGGVGFPRLGCWRVVRVPSSLWWCLGLVFEGMSDMRCWLEKGGERCSATGASLIDPSTASSCAGRVLVGRLDGRARTGVPCILPPRAASALLKGGVRLPGPEMPLLVTVSVSSFIWLGVMGSRWRVHFFRKQTP